MNIRCHECCYDIDNCVALLPVFMRVYKAMFVAIAAGTSNIVILLGMYLMRHLLQVIQVAPSERSSFCHVKLPPRVHHNKNNDNSDNLNNLG